MKNSIKNKPSTILFAMRHGPTTWNLEKRIQGNVETDIVKDAIKPYFQRIKAAKISQPDVIIVSGLKRTTQTAKELIKYNNWTDIAIFIDKDFNERKWGIFEGLSIEAAQDRFFSDPAIKKDFPNAKDWDDGTFKVANGESMNEVAQRVKPALLRALKKYRGKTILLVLHAGVLVSLGLDFQKISRMDFTYEGKMTVKTV